MGVVFLTPPLSVFEQMALDETLAQHPMTEPVLRFYHWTEGPAVTFGYSQFWDFVRRQTPPQAGPLCRRPTGGGVVYHGQDITFSLLFSSQRPHPKEIYAALHGAIERALEQTASLHSRRQGQVPAAAYAPAQGGSASGCFVNPVEDDLLCNGQKILGGAIRCFGTKVLYQGSLQCAGARSNPALRRAVAQGAAAFLAQTWRPCAISEPILAAARSLAQSQYAGAAWNKKF